MVPVIEEKQITLKLITILREGGMLAHPTEHIAIRGGLKGGGEATSLIDLSSERCFYTWMMTLHLGLVNIEVAVLVNFGVAKTP